MEGTTSLVAYQGGLTSAIKGMRNMLDRGPKDLLVVIEVTWGNYLGYHDE